ncbi:glycosyltransferase [Hoeflea sp. TYP-13]|uniref:glycosyltransferase n=1 Tax=Hoeflea sp. TYP-13 TaxID=3230023 RepID=UPI0034C5BA5B
MKRLGKKIVYEIDDNFEEISLHTSIGIYHRTFFRLHILKRFFELSDITRIYSKRMHERALAHGAKPKLINSYFDTSLIKGLERRAASGIIKIAYPTTRLDEPEMEALLFSSLKTILERYPGRVELYLWNKKIPKQLIGVQGVVLNKRQSNYRNFIRSFYSAGFDIGLAPGIDTPFFHSKTNNKYREFGGCKVAGVYANFPPYSDSVEHEHSGILVDSTAKDWVDAIERLILDAELREHIVSNAASDISCNYNFEGAVDVWRTCLSELESDRYGASHWLPPLKRHVQSFGVILTQKTLEEQNRDKRCNWIKLSATNIQNFKVVEKKDYLQLDSSSEYNNLISIFLVDDKQDLSILLTVLPRWKNAIIDFSKFAGEIDEAIHRLQKVANDVDVSFVFSVNQAKNSDTIQSLAERYLITEPSNSPIINEYSLDGYPAIYLDLLEKVAFKPPEKTLYWVHKVAAIRAFMSICFRIKRYFEVIFQYIYWFFRFSRW